MSKFERWFSAEVSLTRARRHLAQAEGSLLVQPAAWLAGNRDAQWLLSRLLNELCTERQEAMEMVEQRRKRGRG